MLSTVYPNLAMLLHANVEVNTACVSIRLLRWYMQPGRCGLQQDLSLFLATFKNDAHTNNGFVWHVKARKREINPGKSGSGQLQLITQLRKDLGVFLEIVFKISMYVMYVCM